MTTPESSSLCPCPCDVGMWEVAGLVPQWCENYHCWMTSGACMMQQGMAVRALRRILPELGTEEGDGEEDCRDEGAGDGGHRDRQWWQDKAAIEQAELERLVTCGSCDAWVMPDGANRSVVINKIFRMAMAIVNKLDGVNWEREDEEEMLNRKRERSRAKCRKRREMKGR